MTPKERMHNYNESLQDALKKYESPIDVVIDDLVTNIRQEQDKTIVEACQKVGVNVNADELVKALNYDRGQFQAGFQLGYETGVAEALERVDTRLYGFVDELREYFKLMVKGDVK